MMTRFILSIALLFTITFVAAQDSAIKWMTWEEAIAANKENPKKIFVDVYTDWCGWCKRMDSGTFKDAQVIEDMNANYYAVKLNAEMRNEVVYNNYTFKFIANERSGVHELAYSLLNGKMSYPSFVILNEQEQRVTVLAGYQQPAQLSKTLTYIAKEEYKKEDSQ
jgi:thioredoxin-related protein